MDHAFFGQRQHLFGTFHPAAGQTRDRAVLIVAPPFGDNLRSHWTLNKTASKLAEAGIDVLRVDLSACGNAPGDLSEVTCETWIADCQEALRELNDLSGSTRTLTFGVRFSAALMLAALDRAGSRSESIAWDPVWGGQQYLEELRATEFGPPSEGVLAGHAVSAELVSSFADFTIEPADAENTFVIATTNSFLGASVAKVDVDCEWALADLKMIYGHDVISTVVDWCGRS
ncbi:MAG: hypothetical protein AAF358_18900 [Pseudomonadota bacterium]